jgi:endoglucanase
MNLFDTRLRAFATAVILTAVLGLSACGGGSDSSADSTSGTSLPPSTQAPPATTGASALAWQTASAMGPGINFGNMLEAPQEGDWGLRVEPSYITAAWQAGFRTVRLPVRWSNHAEAVYPYAIDPVFMTRVEGVVDALLAQGFRVILNMHHHRQLDGDVLDTGEFVVNPSDLEPRFVGLWSQIATRFASRSERLLFELYNEPHGRLTSPAWNILLATTLQTVRISNPQRLVVISPAGYGSTAALGALALPNDRNLLATFHHYEPFNFTHQGATWVTPTPPVGVTCCTAEQTAQIENGITQAKAWSNLTGYPIFLGEFGAYSLADTASRVAYMRTVRFFANAQQIPWMYWEFASGFGIYDPTTGQFRPELTQALLGP